MKPLAVSLVVNILLSLASQCAAQNSSIPSLYSHFDLFKNTQLQPCPINNRTTTEHKDLTLAYWTAAKAKSPDDYCRWMAGTPVVIPTQATGAAFYPSWPTFAIQVVGLMFTYIGLWFTLRKLNKDTEKKDMTLPKTFWIQVPIDIARILAWYVSFFRGLRDLSQFPWISTVIWTVPFNYIWLLLLISGKKIEYDSVPGAPVRKHKKVLRVIIWITIAITVIQWAASLGACIIHYKYTWGAFRTRLYQPLPQAFAEPLSMTPSMPPRCLKFLTTVGLPVNFFSSQNTISAFGTQSIQFVITTLATLAGLNRVRNNDYRRTYTMLRNTAAATQSCLFFGALGLVGYAWGAMRGVSFFVTSDQSVTGPCTFAVIQMWDLWGFYDVQYGRGFRLVLNILGV